MEKTLQDYLLEFTHLIKKSLLNHLGSDTNSER